MTLVITFALLLSWRLMAVAARQGAERRIVFVGMDVVRVTDGSLLADQVVVVAGRRIAAVGPEDEISIPAGARVIDAAGHFLMPGLIDAHIHLRHADDSALRGYLEAGITGAREMNGREFLLDWRDRIDAGEMTGPWLQIAAPTMGNWSSPREGFATPETESDGAAAVERFRRADYDWIKIYSFLPQPGFEGVMNAAHRLGLPVGGHVPVDVGLAATLESGVRSIEHLTEYIGGTLTPQAKALDEEDFRSLFGAGDVDWARLDKFIGVTVRAGIWNVPTLVWFDRILPASMAADAWSDPALRQQGMHNRREVVRRLHAAGALLGVGTDSDAGEDLPATAIHDEIASMVDAGLTRAEALRAATLGNARMLGVESSTGTIEAGRYADLLVLACDPLADLRCMREPRTVVSRGKPAVNHLKSGGPDLPR